MRAAQAPTIRQLQVFIAVIDEESVSGAARKLGVSQPAVTNMIKTLEKEMGTALFRRIGRKMLLTTPGKKVERAARNTLHETSRLLDTVKYAVGNTVAPLRIGYTAPQLVLTAARKFQLVDPLVPLEFHAANTSTLFDMLDDYQVDLISIGINNPSDDYYYQLFARQTLHVLMRVDDPLSHLAEISIAEMEGLPMVLREKGSYTRQSFLDACNKQGVRPNIALEIFGRESVKEASAQGFGYGIVLHRELTPDARLKSIPIKDSKDIASEYLVCRKAAMSFPPLKRFFEVNKRA
ncbi:MULTISPECIES: LysR family transcriptional regulator [Pseudovibrio]|uniref:LysR family transcriptional regulator n=1 Tax=Stappiaceae TaxID=2821832 RepID=UPI0023662194|nr:MULTISPECIES: LysR family transcriptional regulator [Pseudovibrio]MDD7911442.1 LysR family transcriptional regulator [Pseudovibrio exalbescens]MDX5594207.1 LysR family transcriptional regulator [Pseudovibrio sp. SPO723]